MEDLEPVVQKLKEKGYNVRVKLTNDEKVMIYINEKFVSWADAKRLAEE